MVALGLDAFVNVFWLKAPFYEVVAESMIAGLLSAIMFAFVAKAFHKPAYRRRSH